jgi:hypothetical protein
VSLRESDPIAWMLACEEIRQLASRYALAIGRRDLDALVALFVPDVRVGRAAAGRDALRADFERRLAPIGRSILQVTNVVIDVVDADRATGVVGTRAELELDGDWIIQVIEYHDDYERREGRWLFTRRRHQLWYGAPVGTNPLDLPPAHWPASAIGLGDLGDPREILDQR